MQLHPNVKLTTQDQEAIAEAKRKLLQHFPVDRIVLFGSAVRGESDPESDIDLLILTTHPLDRNARHQITDLIFEINLQHETNLSTVVVDRDAWKTGPISALPFHDEVEAQGIQL